MEKGEKIVLAVIIIALLGAAFYFTFLKVGFNVLKAKDSISSKEGLVLELEFDNIANYVYDSSGNKNNVKIYKARFESYGCVSGGCLSFDGFNNSVEIQALGILENLTDNGNSWTFSVMFKPSGLPRQNKPGYILFRQGYHEGVYYDLSGKFGATLWFENKSATNNITTRSLNSGVKLDIVKWYHLAMVVNEKKKEAKLYLDGKQVGKTLSLELPLKDYGKAKYYVGGMPTGPYDSYGWIDEVGVYNRALSDEEVKVLASEK